MPQRQHQPQPLRLLLCNLLALLLLSSCGGDPAPSTSQPPSPGTSPTPLTVRINQGSDALSMDPYHDLESPTFCIQRNIFDALTDYDANIQLVPCLATSWENRTPTEWVFHLRPDVTFHDGQPFTADDAVFSLRRARDWPLSRVASEIPTIADLQAIDDHTLLITTTIPDAILPLRLATILILDRESSEPGLAASGDAFLATRANGTGPYRLAQWRKDEICALEANPDHWAGRPAVDRLEFIPTANDTTRMAALQRAEYDIMVNVPPRMVDRVQSFSGYNVVERPSLRLIYLGLDTDRADSPGITGRPNPLRDPRVRRAVALGIDNVLIVRTIMAGHASPAAQLLPEGITGHIPDLDFPRPDYDRARALLAEAGFPDGFSVRLDGPNDRYVNDEQILQGVAQELARIGITVDVNAEPKSAFFARERAGGCSLFLIGWANTNGDGAGTFEHLLHTPNPDKNLGNSNLSTLYSNPQLDQFVEQAAIEFDTAKRQALLQQANRLAMQDLPHIPLHYQNDIYAVSEHLQWTPRRDTQVRGIDIQPAN